MQTVASAQVMLLSGELFAAPDLDIVPFSLGPLSLADSTTLIQQAAPQVRPQPSSSPILCPSLYRPSLPD